MDVDNDWVPCICVGTAIEEKNMVTALIGAV